MVCSTLRLSTITNPRSSIPFSIDKVTHCLPLIIQANKIEFVSSPKLQRRILGRLAICHKPTSYFLRRQEIQHTIYQHILPHLKTTPPHEYPTPKPAKRIFPYKRFSFQAWLKAIGIVDETVLPTCSKQ